jgi:hypothetical protein
VKDPTRPREVDVLIREIQRYLAFVQALRGAGSIESRRDGKRK